MSEHATPDQHQPASISPRPSWPLPFFADTLLPLHSTALASFNSTSHSAISLCWTASPQDSFSPPKWRMSAMLSRHTHISYHHPHSSAIATSTRPAWRRCQAARSNSKPCHINAWPRTSNCEVSCTPVFSTRLRFTRNALEYQASIREAQGEVATPQPIIASTCENRWLRKTRREPLVQH